MLAFANHRLGMLELLEKERNNLLAFPGTVVFKNGVLKADQ